MENPREIALRGMINLRRNGAWSDLFLKQEMKNEKMSQEDIALCTNILYGTIQNINLIDFYIGNYSSIKLTKLTPQILDILRICVYQIVFLTKIPHSAAVNEGVKLAKKYANSGSAGFVNGVLRTITKNFKDLPEVPRKNTIDYFNIIYSQPKWFVAEMVARLGEADAEKLFIANNVRATSTARVNTLKTTTVALIESLKTQNIPAHKSDEISGAIIFERSQNIVDNSLFKDGHYYIQDLASQLAVLVLDPKKGSTLIDMCAAPGGKSLLACQLMENVGEIISCDMYEHKAKIIEANAKKYGAGIVKAAVKDSTIIDDALVSLADYILCDVPCSGMGIIRKKPDIRFKEKDEVAQLPQIQYNILKNAAKYLKSGGTIVYSTCTVRKEENEDVIAKFMAENVGFKLLSFELPIDADGSGGMVTLYPHKTNCDGFFIAKLRKI